MPWAPVTLVVDHGMRAMCVRPYPGHKRGCPNFNGRSNCPPKAGLIEKVLDLSAPVWAVWVTFDLAAHAERMRQAHPEWSRQQLVNCLYWQGGVRKELHDETEVFLAGHPGCIALDCPEACGVNVTATMLAIGVELQWPPVALVHKVAIVGTPVPRDLPPIVGIPWPD